MLVSIKRVRFGRPALYAALFGALILAFATCGEDDPVSPPIDLPENELGDMPAVPKPASLTSEAESETVTVIKPLLVAFAPNVYNTLTDWTLKSQACDEELWIVSCGSWTQGDYPGTWMDGLPDAWGYRPPTPFKVQLTNASGGLIAPEGYYHRKNEIAHRRCGFLSCCYCWYNVIWEAPLPPAADPPYLCRDRFWVVAGKSQILPQGFSQEITTTVTQGVETTECDNFAASLTLEGQVSNGVGTLKTTIEASYSKSVTKAVFEQSTVETRYTPEPVPDGKVAVYQVWVLVDRYTLTDRNGKPYHDASYRFGATKCVHVQGVWEAHAITYFPAAAYLAERAGN